MKWFPKVAVGWTAEIQFPVGVVLGFFFSLLLCSGQLWCPPTLLSNEYWWLLHKG